MRFDDEILHDGRLRDEICARRSKRRVAHVYKSSRSSHGRKLRESVCSQPTA